MKTAILLVNLGSPASPSVADVRTYLREFLMDGRVIDIPYWLRYPLVNGIIAPFRARSSAKKYQSIWTDQGSPLIVTSKELTRLVDEVGDMPTYLCMRYANPTPTATLRQIQREHPGLDRVILFPLYPHYAMSSYETAVVHVQNAWEEGNYSFSLEVVQPYYDYPAYIQNLADSIRPFLEQRWDYLLFSYHGVPERHIRKSDTTGGHCLKDGSCCQRPSPAHEECYRHQVIRTTELAAEALGLNAGRYGYSFQSRLGSDQWLKPYTADLMKELPKKGVKNLLVVCPAFVSDCLETLEEIEEEGCELFMEAGGESFHMIPCLNTRPDWVQTILELAKKASA